VKVAIVGSGGGLQRAVDVALREHGNHLVVASPSANAAMSVGDVDVVLDVSEPGEGRAHAPTSRATTTQQLLRHFNGRTGRYIFVSSVLVYAPVASQEFWPIQEHYPRVAHGDPASEAYGQDCIDAEDLIIREWAPRELSYAILRPTVLWGSATPNVASILVQAALRHPWWAAHAYDLGVMQWLDVRDAARAVVLACTLPTVDRDTFTLAGLDGFTSADVVGSLCQGVDLMRDASPLKFDIAKAEVVLGWCPEWRVGEQAADVGRRSRWSADSAYPTFPERRVDVRDVQRVDAEPGAWHDHGVR
jgi:hypothetical protein